MESVSSVLQFSILCLMATLSFLRIYAVQFQKKSIQPMEISAGGGGGGLWQSFSGYHKAKLKKRMKNKQG